MGAAVTQETRMHSHDAAFRSCSSRCGLPPEHMRRACEWYCYMKSHAPARILKEHNRKSKTKQAAPQENDIPQPTLGTGIDWNGFHTSTRYPNSTD